jgi:hypothetical protein
MKHTAFAVTLAFLGIAPLTRSPSYAGLQHNIDPPRGARLVLDVTGRGVQIYSCQPTSEGYRWKFIAPKADLFNPAGRDIGRHFAGPTWEMQDGSEIVGVVVTQASAPDTESVPWLLVRVKSQHGAGVLSDVEFVRRIDTQGGVAPARGCDAEHALGQARMRYTAQYLFYSISR